MYLSGLTHCDRLFDVATRWLADRLESTDGRIVTEIFAFERAITAPTVRRFVADLCRTCHRGDLYMERITSKDEVRSAIVAAASHPSTRVAELIDWYRQLPEEFFPRTPVRMSLVTLRNGRLTAIVRRKRIRRIADKVSRRVAEQLTGEIVAVARALASSRPRPIAGAERDIAPPSTPAAVGGAAERLVADRIRSGRITLDPEKNRVDDVIGVKIIGSPVELERVEASLDHFEYTFASQREVKAGTYEGVHYLVDLELPPNKTILANMAGIDWAFAAGRGLRIESLDESFRAYIESCRRTFRVELILTTFDDLVESEFGVSIHEQRILDQRDLADDFGRIARNASSIIEYMLRLATSPTITIDHIPIKIWGRYIRDTLNYAIASLGEGEPTEWLVPEEHLEDLMQL
ncbi:MAG: hypothetical protein EP299_03875 [Acidobacteria bacterium]|nr:MAG: hypothetical protein EP299_03875 [Acidobacteriota bacterium]